MTGTRESITIGQEVLVKVCGRIIGASIQEILPDGWMVKSLASGKTFKTRKLHEQPANEHAAEVESQPAVEPAPETLVAKQPGPAAEPAPEAPRSRKMSLLDAAIEVLKLEAKALNTREMVKLAVERGLWVQTSCKTPEQSLYGAIFLEMKKSAAPRFKKSEKKGAFEYAG